MVFLLRDFLQHEVSQEGNYRVIAELTVRADSKEGYAAWRGWDS
jgi:hypothetical protein